MSKKQTVSEFAEELILNIAEYSLDNISIYRGTSMGDLIKETAKQMFYDNCRVGCIHLIYRSCSIYLELYYKHLTEKYRKQMRANAPKFIFDNYGADNHIFSDIYLKGFNICCEKKQTPVAKWFCEQMSDIPSISSYMEKELNSLMHYDKNLK